MLGQLALRGQLVAGAQLAPLEEPLDLGDYPLVKPVTPDGLQYRQFRRLPLFLEGGLLV